MLEARKQWNGMFKVPKKITVNLEFYTLRSYPSKSIIRKIKAKRISAYFC